MNLSANFLSNLMGSSSPYSCHPCAGRGLLDTCYFRGDSGTGGRNAIVFLRSEHEKYFQLNWLRPKDFSFASLVEMTNWEDSLDRDLQSLLQNNVKKTFGITNPERTIFWDTLVGDFLLAFLSYNPQCQMIGGFNPPEFIPMGIT